jgi:hypothetical protein
MTPKDALAAFRVLKPGEFFAFGPAFHEIYPAIMRVGAIETSHPKVGHTQKTTPPKPSEAIKALLPKLADLPPRPRRKLARWPICSVSLGTARKELKQAQRQQPTAEAVVKVDATAHRRDAATIKRLRAMLEEQMKILVRINASGVAQRKPARPGGYP